MEEREIIEHFIYSHMEIEFVGAFYIISINYANTTFYQKYLIDIDDAGDFEEFQDECKQDFVEQCLNNDEILNYYLEKIEEEKRGF